MMTVTRRIDRVLHVAGLLALSYLFVSALVGSDSGGGAHPPPPRVIAASHAPEASPRVVSVDRIVEGSPRVVTVERVVEGSPRVVERIVESSPRVITKLTVVEGSPRVEIRRESSAPSAAEQGTRLYSSAGHAFLAANDLPVEGLAPWTREAQAFLVAHQFPSPDRCASAQFLRADHYHSGLGSQIHVAGWQLGHAIAQNRIFFWSDTAGNPYAQEAVCGAVRNWECYFQRPTNCSTSTLSNPGNTVGGQDPGEWSADKNFVPPVLRDKLLGMAPHMTFDEVKYWWRAQSSAFIMRMNDRTVEALRILRTAERMVHIAPASGVPYADHLNRQPKPLFPLPPGSVSFHIRHGDKGKEMVLKPFAAFLDAAEDLTKLNPLFLRRSFFLSTEDPEAIEQAKANTKGWAALYSDIPRHNSNGWDQMHLANDLVRVHFVQLLMALECDAWVGTRGSNWNRLIDELRCVWVAKCTAPYVEVGEARNWKEYDWR